MDLLLHLANSPSLPLPLNEYQSSEPNAKTMPGTGVTVDFSSRKLTSWRSCSSRSFATNWMLKPQSDGMLSPALNILAEPRTCIFFDSTSEHASHAVVKEDFTLTKALFPHKRIGRYFPRPSNTNNQWAEKLGKRLQKFPVKKLSKSPDARTPDSDVLGSEVQVNMATDDSEGSEDNVALNRKSPNNRKRSISDTLKRAASVLGAAGTFTGFHHRLGESKLEYHGGNGPGHNSGSGGGWGGGDSPGGDKLGPGNFDANNEGFPPVHLNAFDHDVEEEWSLMSKQDSNALDTASDAPDENAGETPRNEIKNLTSRHEDCQRDLESDCLAEGDLSEGISQRLIEAVRGFYSDHLAGQSEFNETSLDVLNLGPPQEHDSAVVTSWNHDDAAIRTSLQYCDEDVGAEGLAEPIGMELLGKVRGLTLGHVKPSLVGKEKVRAEKLDLLRREEGIPQHEAMNKRNSDEESGTSVADFETVQMSDSQTVAAANNAKEPPSQGETSEMQSSESELYAKSSGTVGQQQGVLDQFVRFAHSLVPKQPVWRLRTSKKNQVEEEKLNNLVNERVASAVKQVLGTDGNPLPAKQAEIEALRRLQRETFSDLLKLRERLDKLEQLTSMRSPPGVLRTHMKGEVKACTAFVMLEESNFRHSRASLEQAGMQTGLDVRFTFETPFRERDLLITQCMAGQGSSVGDGRALGGPMTMGKVLYLAQMNDDVSISFVPLGAQAKDVTEIINPLQDQGLTTVSSNGPALFNNCKGSALGATISGGSFAFSLAQYLSGWGNYVSAMGTTAAETDPLCLSTLGQFLFQPSERIIFSFTGLNRYWPCPPLPSSMSMHWSEMGPLVIPKIKSMQRSRSSLSSHTSMDTSVSHAHSIGSNWGIHDLEYGNDTLDSMGFAVQSIAVASELDLGGNISVGGWAQIERGDWLQDSVKRNSQWALNLAKTSASGIDWGVSVGGSQPDFWNITTNDQEGSPSYTSGSMQLYGSQVHLEAFLKINCGRGFTMQPGLVYVLNKHSHTPAFMVRSSWLL